jgi:arabinan endo-1,5-alpha-L-arabinosidase
MLYHAVDRNAPFFEGHPGYTRRPALIDALDWVNEWPVVRGGFGPSDDQQPAPAAQAGEASAPPSPLRQEIEPGELLAAYSDEFNGERLSPQWTFLHPAADTSYKMTGTAFEAPTTAFDLTGDAARVSVLAEPAPRGVYLAETKLRTTIPPGPACCFNFAQGALVIYGDDQNNIKLNVFADYNTRQVEFGKQAGPVPQGYPTYGSGLVGPPGADTWLRILVEPRNGYELYTAYSSNDGTHWSRGGTWTHQLGETARIGLVAQNLAGFLVDFDYVRVYRLRPARRASSAREPGDVGRTR